MKKKCPHCGGSGKVLDHAKVGRKLRQQRELLKVPAKIVASAMNISAAYVSDLESGKRNWTEEKIAAYKKAIRDA